MVWIQPDEHHRPFRTKILLPENMPSGFPNHDRAAALAGRLDPQ